MNNTETSKPTSPDSELETVTDPDDKHLRPIQTYKELLEEEQRLTMKLKREKTAVNDSVYRLKSKFEPATNLLQSVSNVFGPKEKPGIVSQGVGVVMDLVTQKYLFKRSGWLMTLVGSYAVKGLSKFLLQNKKRNQPQDGMPGQEEREAMIARSKKQNGTKI